MFQTRRDGDCLGEIQGRKEAEGTALVLQGVSDVFIEEEMNKPKRLDGMP